jgi:hypothetical protein
MTRTLRALVSILPASKKSSKCYIENPHYHGGVMIARDKIRQTLVLIPIIRKTSQKAARKRPRPKMESNYYKAKPERPTGGP